MGTMTYKDGFYFLKIDGKWYVAKDNYILYFDKVEEVEEEIKKKVGE